jgi:hypothetical protein
MTPIEYNGSLPGEGEQPEHEVALLDCPHCWRGLQPREDGLYYDDDVVICVCGSASVMWVDDNGSAYIRSWTCPHGIDDEEPCDACEVVR